MNWKSVTLILKKEEKKFRISPMSVFPLLPFDKFFALFREIEDQGQIEAGKAIRLWLEGGRKRWPHTSTAAKYFIGQRFKGALDFCKQIAILNGVQKDFVFSDFSQDSFPRAIEMLLTSPSFFLHQHEFFGDPFAIWVHLDAVKKEGLYKKTFGQLPKPEWVSRN